MNQAFKGGDQERFRELKLFLLKLERCSTKNEIEDLDVGTTDEISPQKPQIENSYLNTKSNQVPINDTKIPPFSDKDEIYLEKVVQQNVKKYDKSVNVIIVGPKSSGKTTLMRALLNIETPISVEETHGFDSKHIVTNVKGTFIKFKVIDSDSDRSKESIRKGNYS